VQVTQTPAAGTLVGLGVTTVSLHVIDGANNESTCTGSFTVVNTPPTVDGPSDLVRSAGQSAAFNATVSGTGPFSYQWSKDGVNINGATDPIYSFASVTVTDAGAYCLVARGGCTSVTNCANLTVLEPTTTSPINDLTLITGGSGTFSTTPSGTGPFDYQWTKDGEVITGATNSSYTVGPVTPGDAGTYCVIVTGAANSVTNCATLTVLEPTTATPINDLTLITGGSGTFSTTPSGTGPFDYQWTKDGEVITGATNSSYTVGPVTPGDAGTYCVIVTGAANSVTNCATLTVLEPTTA